MAKRRAPEEKANWPTELLNGVQPDQQQLGQIRSLTGQNWASASRSSFFFFGVQVQIFIDVLHNRGLQTGDLVDFVQKIVKLAVNGGQED